MRTKRKEKDIRKKARKKRGIDRVEMVDSQLLGLGIKRNRERM